MSGKNINIGGNRLGSGAKMNVHLHSYERSTHDLSYIWRNTQAAGTLVPFMVEVGLPGDTFDINLNADVKTMPTLAPLFGSFKLQLDVFKCPIRLYQGKLHNNALKVGLDMKQIKLPQIVLEANAIDYKNDRIINEEQQISKSSLLNYLGINGIGGVSPGDTNKTIKRSKNAIPLLAYWDIYKNYYANKQEEIGMYINHDNEEVDIINIIDNRTGLVTKRYHINEEDKSPIRWIVQPDEYIKFIGNKLNPDNLQIEWFNGVTGDITTTNLRDSKLVITNATNNQIDILVGEYQELTSAMYIKKISYIKKPKELSISKFPLENIDEMRNQIMLYSTGSSPFLLSNDEYLEPYINIIKYNKDREKNYSQYQQQGLALKTYQSDVFNNWISTEWIDGANGINEITAVDVKSGKLSLDSLNLAQKVYNMLNRVAVSGGTYQDWIEAVYATDYISNTETPVYCGGLSKEIVFQEVVSTAGTTNEPLGSLAGRGILNGKHKGGYVTVKIDEPSYIMGIISITPRIDYTQGNRWDTRLKTMDDFHKPALDGIGFQDLITEQMYAGESIGTNDENESLFSAGKQPAWINYMTNYNRCHGHFAEVNNQMFMTLNRRYEVDKETGRIKDLTTYIDPSKFNYVFAQTDIHAMNFWVQVANNITTRRKMSAKQIPNL